MSMHPASLTGMVGVRLTDVPLKIRRRVGRQLASRMMLDGDEDMMRLLVKRSEIEVAIEEPSDRVYMVPRAAFEKAKQKW